MKITDNRPTLTVGVAFDESYLLPGLVALVSAAKALRDQCDGLVVMADVSDASLDFVAKVGHRNGLSIRRVRPSARTTRLSHLPHLSPMTNARLDLSAWDIDTDHFLYLDSDTFTVRSPRLPSTIPAGAVACAAMDAVIPTHGRLAHLRPDLASPALFSRESREIYVNAGVLLVEVAAWTDQAVGELCMELMTKFPRLSDQDALNIALLGRKYVLPPQMNAQTAFRSSIPGRTLIPRGREIDWGDERSAVIHFTADKPWKSPKPKPSHLRWLAFLLRQIPSPRDSTRWVAGSLASL